VIELHGGRVEAHSSGVGAGSEFVVFLPVEPGIETTPRNEPPGRTEASSNPLRILVVEDNPDTAESFTTLLGIWGHKALFALDAQAALSTADSFAPDVMICDLGLPGMDGYELARTIRRQPALRGATLIALSGYGRDEDRTRSAEAGFDHHLVKPADLEAIADLLATIATTKRDKSERGVGTGD
jgi:CheY-like chemotaxis protein